MNNIWPRVWLAGTDLAFNVTVIVIQHDGGCDRTGKDG